MEIDSSGAERSTETVVTDVTVVLGHTWLFTSGEQTNCHSYSSNWRYSRGINCSRELLLAGEEGR